MTVLSKGVDGIITTEHFGAFYQVLPNSCGRKDTYSTALKFGEDR